MNKMKIVRRMLVLALVGVMVLGMVATAAAEIPVLRFIEPDEGDAVSGVVFVEVFTPAPLLLADGPSPTKEVRLLVDGEHVHTLSPLTEMLYVTKWDSTTVPNGKHMLTAVEIQWTHPPIVKSVNIMVFVRNDLPSLDEIGRETVAGGTEIALADSTTTVFETDPPELPPDDGKAHPPVYTDPGAVPTPLPPPYLSSDDGKAPAPPPVYSDPGPVPTPVPPPTPA